jgi:hypothetical protein
VAQQHRHPVLQLMSHCAKPCRKYRHVIIGTGQNALVPSARVETACCPIVLLILIAPATTLPRIAHKPFKMTSSLAQLPEDCLRLVLGFCIKHDSHGPPGVTHLVRLRSVCREFGTRPLLKAATDLP